MSPIQIHGKSFRPFLTQDQILEAIDKMAAEMNRLYSGQTPVFVITLKGAFMFAAELLQRIDFECEVEFVQVQSYQQDQSTGKADYLLKLNRDLKGRTVIVLEDIVETGNTIRFLHQELKEAGAGKIAIATLLLKPDIYKNELPLDHVGLSIGNEFVVGFGLDYDGLGRNLKELFIAD